MDMSMVLVAVLMKTEVPYSARCSVKISCLFVPHYFYFLKSCESRQGYSSHFIDEKKKTLVLMVNR